MLNILLQAIACSSNVGLQVIHEEIHPHHVTGALVKDVAMYRIPSPSPAHFATLRESVKQQQMIFIGWLVQTSQRPRKLLPVIFFLNY